MNMSGDWMSETVVYIPALECIQTKQWRAFLLLPRLFLGHEAIPFHPFWVRSGMYGQC